MTEQFTNYNIHVYVCIMETCFMVLYMSVVCDHDWVGYHVYLWHGISMC